MNSRYVEYKVRKKMTRTNGSSLDLTIRKLFHPGSFNCSGSTRKVRTALPQNQIHESVKMSKHYASA